jgi:3-methylfumaryl-CoA hydratase
MAIIDIGHLKTWVGRKQQMAATLDPFPARALAAALDQPAVPQDGDLLAPYAHWLYFLETPSAAATGGDGHPHKGGFLPPVPLPRRMWAAGDVDVVQPLRLGRLTHKSSIVRSVDLKSGKTGALVFVALEHEIRQEGKVCIREEQTLVYREIPTQMDPIAVAEAAPVDSQWSRRLEPSSVLLFRYSALTYNAHRIHYDRDYATRSEFYPGLVVHAPLLATLLVDLALRENSGARLVRFRFRAIRPTFDLGAVHLCGKFEGPEIALWSTDDQDRVGMRVSAILGGAS